MKVLFYRTKNKEVITDYIDQLPYKQQVKVTRAINHIVEHGTTRAIPNTRKITSTSLWEIRILGQDSIRIVYSRVAKDTIAILNIFKKKSQKTPRREIIKALQRRKEMIKQIKD